MMEKPKEHVAYHEAGHAVIAFVLGCQDVSIDLMPEQNSAGRAPYTHPPETRPSTVWDAARRVSMGYRDAIIWHAGAIAEAKFSGEGADKTGEEGDKRRIDGVSGAVAMWDEDQKDRWKENMREIAGLLVENAWPAIESVAKAAIPRCGLSAEQVNHFITDSWSGPERAAPVQEPDQKG